MGIFEVRKMMKKDFGLVVKVSVCVLLVMFLCFVPACKKSSPDSAETDTTVTKSTGPAEMVPIEIELPKPMFVGTPQDTRVPNLEKPLGKPRPPFLAPAGTTNVAFEKPVASSDEEPIIGDRTYHRRHRNDYRRRQRGRRWQLR